MRKVLSHLKNLIFFDNKRTLIWNFKSVWGGGNFGEDNFFIIAIRRSDGKLIYFEKFARLEL